MDEASQVAEENLIAGKARLGRVAVGLPLAALLVGNMMLALGPWAVRWSDSGPVSAAFWRLFLALPLLALIARQTGQRIAGVERKAVLAALLAGVLFSFDLASWHIGIERTRMANATLFGNGGSLILMVWGIVAVRRLPRVGEALAVLLAIGGAAILMGRSIEIDTRTLTGDLFCILAGFFYGFYILLLHDARTRFGSWSLLLLASAAGAPVLLAIALLRGEPVWPHAWGPLIALALGSQVIGQGLLVYSFKHFSPLVIGLALLTQPAVAVLVGWSVFGEDMGWLDGLGMVLVAAALVLSRRFDPKDDPPEPAGSD
ncbi:MAG: DMT family transporter [Sphingomonadales bacterium]|nr:DMT family transporter [Sphingomonadales bacterium]MDE2568268.1 DMT family transporter [Sphingomonadales bacterium]